MISNRPSSFPSFVFSRRASFSFELPLPSVGSPIGMFVFNRTPSSLVVSRRLPSSPTVFRHSSSSFPIASRRHESFSRLSLSTVDPPSLAPPCRLEPLVFVLFRRLFVVAPHRTSRVSLLACYATHGYRTWLDRPSTWRVTRIFGGGRPHEEGGRSPIRLTK